MFQLKVTVAIIWALAIISHVASGATRTWDNSGAAPDNQWFNPDNWADGMVPVDGDDIVFDTGGEFITGWTNFHRYGSLHIKQGNWRFNSQTQFHVGDVTLDAGARVGFTQLRVIGTADIVNKGIFTWDQVFAEPDATITYSGTGTLEERDWAPGVQSVLFLELDGTVGGSLTLNAPMTFLDRSNGVEGGNLVTNGHDITMTQLPTVEGGHAPTATVYVNDADFGDSTIIGVISHDGGTGDLTANGATLIFTGFGALFGDGVSFTNTTLHIQNLGTAHDGQMLGLWPSGAEGGPFAPNEMAARDWTSTKFIIDLDTGIGDATFQMSNFATGSAPHGAGITNDSGPFFGQTFVGTPRQANGLIEEIELRSGKLDVVSYALWVEKMHSTGGMIDLNSRNLYVNKYLTDVPTLMASVIDGGQVFEFSFLGDMDFDGDIDFDDIDNFVQGLNDPDGYESAIGVPNTWMGDTDGDGDLDFDDITGFVAALSGGQAASFEAVPEPSSLLLAALGGLGLVVLGFVANTRTV